MRRAIQKTPAGARRQGRWPRRCCGRWARRECFAGGRGSCLRTDAACSVLVTIQMRDIGKMGARRSTVCSSMVLPPTMLSNCLGVRWRLRGQKRVPRPPARMMAWAGSLPRAHSCTTLAMSTGVMPRAASSLPNSLQIGDAGVQQRGAAIPARVDRRRARRAETRPARAGSDRLAIRYPTGCRRCPTRTISNSNRSGDVSRARASENSQRSTAKYGQAARNVSSSGPLRHGDRFDARRPAARRNCMHVDRLPQVQRTRLAVGLEAAVVEDAIRDVRVLLNFAQHHAGADGVHGARRERKKRHSARTGTRAGSSSAVPSVDGAAKALAA